MSKQRADLLGKLVYMSFRPAWVSGAFSRCKPGTTRQEFRVMNAVEVDSGTVHLNILPTAVSPFGNSFRQGTTTTLANVELV